MNLKTEKKKLQRTVRIYEKLVKPVLVRGEVTNAREGIDIILRIENDLNGDYLRSNRPYQPYLRNIACHLDYVLNKTLTPDRAVQFIDNSIKDVNEYLSGKFSPSS